MDIKKNPFPSKPPKFIRMQLYHYHFTGATNKIVPKNDLDWWSRKFVSEYLPAISLEQEADIVKILSQMGVVTSPKKSKVKGIASVLKHYLDCIRRANYYPECNLNSKNYFYHLYIYLNIIGK